MAMPDLPKLPGTAMAQTLADTALVKLLGISLLLIVVCAITQYESGRFLDQDNLANVLRRIGLYGILGIGVAFVIITGGIDLSIGSLVGLVACFLPYLVVERHWSFTAAIVLLLGVSLLLGLTHGVLITKLKLQPFVVTLCGLMIYRGLPRGLLEERQQGFGSDLGPLVKQITAYQVLYVPMAFWIMLAIAIVAAVFLNFTIYGRYLLALGRNEQAARYSGIRTDLITIVAYVICAVLAGVGGILNIFDTNSGQPAQTGSLYELYAIAAAVLGGCSLRGGEGSISGVVIGTALMQVLYNAINLLGIGTEWEFLIIGSVLLAGVIADELVKRLAARRRAVRQAV